MEKAKLKVVRFGDSDVIATSGKITSFSLIGLRNGSNDAYFQFGNDKVYFADSDFQTKLFSGLKEIYNKDFTDDNTRFKVNSSSGGAITSEKASMLKALEETGSYATNKNYTYENYSVFKDTYYFDIKSSN